MSNKKEIIILESSDEAAQYKTDLSGWVSGGRVWNDERTARYSGCTHKLCECGEVVRKNSWCKPCHDKKREAIFCDMPSKEWKGEVPVVVFDGDDYFFDIESFYDYCEEHEILKSDVQLVFCTPNYAREIETDYWQDDFPDDGGDLPDGMQEALDALNRVIKKNKPVLSWSQGDVKALYK